MAKDKPLIVRYEDLPTGNFFRIAARPDLGEFFKCQPWVSTTADLEKIFCCKADVEVLVTNQDGKIWKGCHGGGSEGNEMRKGEWVALYRKMRVECCRCSLVHDIEVRVHKTLGPQWRATPKSVRAATKNELKEINRER